MKFKLHYYANDPGYLPSLADQIPVPWAAPSLLVAILGFGPKSCAQAWLRRQAKLIRPESIQ